MKPQACRDTSRAEDIKKGVSNRWSRRGAPVTVVCEFARPPETESAVCKPVSLARQVEMLGPGWQVSLCP